MTDSGNKCPEIQKALLDGVADGGRTWSPPADLLVHIHRCEECSRYLRGLMMTGDLFNRSDLYSVALRQGTLRRVRQQSDSRIDWGSKFIPLWAILATGFSFVIPVWVLMHIFNAWLQSPVVSLCISLTAQTMIGIVISCVCGVFFVGNSSRSVTVRSLSLEENHA